MAPSMVSIRTLGMNAYHHHLEFAFGDTRDASEIQPIGAGSTPAAHAASSAWRLELQRRRNHCFSH